MALLQIVALNAIENIGNFTAASIVQNGWKQGRDLSVHSWLYTLKYWLLQRP